MTYLIHGDKVITVTLTDREALKLRELLEKRGNKDPDLGRVHYKVHHALQRPVIKPRWPNPGKPQRFKFNTDEDQ